MIDFYIRTNLNSIEIQNEKAIREAAFDYLPTEFVKYHFNEDWYCAHCHHQNQKDYQFCEDCFFEKSVFGDEYLELV